VLPLNGIQIDDTGRKVVFPNIKNKFRFVTVSLLLASLVTVISNASAAPDPDVDLPFNFSVTDCSDSDTDPDWSPTIDSMLTDTSVEVGETGGVSVIYSFLDGMTSCMDPGYLDHLVGGNVSTSLVITGESWGASTECDESCGVTTADIGVSGTYTVPSDAGGPYSGVFSLTWTPGGPPS